MLQCNRPQAIRALFKQIPYAKPKRIALIGGGCSVASESTVDISQYFNLMQVKYLLDIGGSGLQSHCRMHFSCKPLLPILYVPLPSMWLVTSF